MYTIHKFKIITYFCYIYIDYKLLRILKTYILIDVYYYFGMQ